MLNTPITITEILIQGEKGQRGLNYHQEENVEINSVLAVIDLIRIIAERAGKHHIEHMGDADITRAISDEFTFYPKEAPFTLDEYKEIIRHTAEIASTLAPDVHLVLATFPVLWPDGGVHNCGLYVQSPKSDNKAPILHHFTKQNLPFNGDITYLRKMQGESSSFPLTTNKNGRREHLPSALLRGTEISVNDVNQYTSALKIFTSNGKTLIVSLAVCLDHLRGVARDDIHGLMDQLHRNHQSMPLFCSQVIVSNTQELLGAHIVSTISHADPNPLYRAGMQVNNNQVQSKHTITSVFSGVLSIEIYVPKFIGILHSDLFQHAIAYQPAFNVNYPNLQGDTLLHQVFLEQPFNLELMAKRLYILVVHGADPFLRNSDGQSALDMTKEIARPKDQELVMKAMRSALEWRDDYAKMNKISLKSVRRLMLTRTLMHDMVSDNFNETYRLIANGANPFLKNSSHRSVMEIIDANAQVKKNIEIKARIKELFLKRQYGFVAEKALYGEDVHLNLTDSIPGVIFNNVLWFSSGKTKQIANFKHQLIEASEIVEVEEKNHKYFCVFKEIKKNELRLKDIFPEIVPFIVENINSGEGFSSRELRAWILLRLIELPFEIISTVHEIILIKSALSQDEFLSLYVAVIEILPKILTSTNEVVEVLTLFSPEYRSNIFVNIKPCLPSLLEAQGEINSFFSYLLPEEITLLLDSLEPLILKVLTGQYQVWLFMRELTRENFVEIFNKIAPHLLTLMQNEKNMYLVKLLKKFSGTQEEIKDALRSLAPRFSEKERASFGLSVSVFTDVGLWGGRLSHPEVSCAVIASRL